MSGSNCFSARAPRRPSDIHEQAAIAAESSGHLGRHDGHVGPLRVLRCRDDREALLPKLLGDLSYTEIGVDDVDVGYGDVFIQTVETKGEVEHPLRLAGTESTGDCHRLRPPDTGGVRFV